MYNLGKEIKNGDECIMEKAKLIEKLHTQCGISCEVAEDALERGGWDILEALKILENEGKIAPLTSAMTTAENTRGYEEVKATASRGKRSREGSGFGEKIAELFRSAFIYNFKIRRRGEVILNLPVAIVAVIVVFAFELCLIALLAGLFCGCTYSVEK